MLYLRQATSQTVMVGPYTGSDGAALTGLTLTQSTLMLSKNGTAFVAKNETSNGSHRLMGMYSVMFDNTDTGSLGQLKLISSAAAALLVWHEFTVLPTSVYDAMIEGSTLLQVNLGQWRGTQPNNLSSNRVDATIGAIQDTVITSAAYAQTAIDRIVNNVWDEPLSETRASSTYGSKVQSLSLSGGSAPTAAENAAAVWASDISTRAVNLTHIDGNATAGNSATLNLRQLNIQNDSASFVIISKSNAAIFMTAGGFAAAQLTNNFNGGIGLSVTAASGTGVNISAGVNGVAISGGGTNAAVSISQNSGTGLSITGYDGAVIAGNGANRRGLSITGQSGTALSVLAPSGSVVNSEFADAIGDGVWNAPLGDTRPDSTYGTKIQSLSTGGTAPTAAENAAAVWASAVSTRAVNLTHIDGNATSANSAVLKLRQLHVANDSSAVVLVSNSAQACDMQVSAPGMAALRILSNSGIAMQVSGFVGLSVGGGTSAVQFDGELGPALGLYGTGSYHLVEIEATNGWNAIHVTAESGNAVSLASSLLPLNVSGPSGSVVNSQFADALADAIWNQPLADTRVQSSYGSKVQSLSLTGGAPTAAENAAAVWASGVSTKTVNLSHIDGNATAAHSAILRLRQLHVRDTDSHGVIFESLSFTALNVQGGNAGAWIQGGVGVGLVIDDGLEINGFGGKPGLAIYGGNSYHAIDIQAAGNNPAVSIFSPGGGEGVKIVADSASALKVAGGAYGIEVNAGKDAALGLYGGNSYHAVEIQGANDWDALNISAFGNASALRLNGGRSRAAVVIQANSGPGIEVGALGTAVSLQSDSGYGLLAYGAGGGLSAQSENRAVFLYSFSATAVYIQGQSGIDISPENGPALGIYGTSSDHAIEIVARNAWDAIHVTAESARALSLVSSVNALHVSAMSGFPVNSETMAAFADALLGRNMASVGGAAARSPLNAFRALRNRVTTSGGLTVYGENDTTAVWTAALTATSAAPIVEVDPA